MSPRKQHQSDMLTLYALRLQNHSFLFTRVLMFLVDTQHYTSLESLEFTISLVNFGGKGRISMIPSELVFMGTSFGSTYLTGFWRYWSGKTGCPGGLGILGEIHVMMKSNAMCGIYQNQSHLC